VRLARFQFVTKPTKRAKLTKKYVFAPVDGRGDEVIFFVSLASFVLFVIDWTMRSARTVAVCLQHP
jgi:hypothetical protein